jgi:hypothetical protein
MARTDGVGGRNHSEGVGSTDAAGGVDAPEGVPVKNAQPANTGNTTETANPGANQTQTNGQQAAGATDSTKQPGYEDKVKAEKERILAEDPVYQEDKDTLDQLTPDMIALLAWIQHHFGMHSDGLISQGDLNDSLKDGSRMGEEDKVKIRAFMASPAFRRLMAKGGGYVKLSDLQPMREEMQGKVKAGKENAEAKAKGAVPTSQPATGGTGGTTEGKKADEPAIKTVDEVIGSIPKPAESSLPGYGGALENLTNTVDYMKNCVLALAREIQKNPDKSTELSTKMAMMQNDIQQVMNMINQLNTMMSNISKLWSDMAMNAIRNIK